MPTKFGYINLTLNIELGGIEKGAQTFIDPSRRLHGREMFGNPSQQAWGVYHGQRYV
jgi:hypothetical protein